MIPIIFILQSCGKQVKRVENPFNNKPNEERLRIIESRMFDLEQQVNGNIESMELLTDLLNDFQDENIQSLTDINIRIEALENDTDDLLTTMIELRGYSLTKIIDPCGDGAGFDEVLLRTGSGKIIAYFEYGNSRFLSTIPTGSYRTTDGTNCNFEVTSGGFVLHTVNSIIISE